LIIQQFFRHAQQGSHQTTFDHEKVAILLARWFDLQLDTDDSQATEQRTGMPSARAGRVGHPQIAHVQFGETQIYFSLSAEHHAAARALVHCLAERAVLTTDMTSPPCAMAEFVPLWLKDRSHAVPDYYLDRAETHDIEQYFAANAYALQEHLGVRIAEPSSELGLIANADALRFHRDRLVNQYAYLERASEPRTAFSVAQSLTLIDWDMQANTLSGTLFDHPNGDRYLFCLLPAESVSLFFTEPTRGLGPMMLPYHCALPVIDYAASQSVGMAKGKRLSTVLRGLVRTEQLADLRQRAVSLQINDVEHVDDAVRVYTNGVTISKGPSVLPTYQGQLVDDRAEALTIVELAAREQHAFLQALLGRVPPTARLFHIEKLSAGFSRLATALPEFCESEHAILLNRSRHCPQQKRNYPLTLDFLQCQLPWLQLLPLGPGDAVEIPRAVRSIAKLSPCAELLHRWALKDSFYPRASATARQVIAVDLVLF